ncbi:MAG: DUF2306 domain-containing protein [Pseudomonadota bacterium]
MAFIVGYYGSRTLRGNFAAWNDKSLIDGYIAGDLAGNLMFISHVLLAVVVVLGGLVQLVPAIRKHAINVHRWNGRVFLAVSSFLALGGLWLTFGRGTALSTVSAIATAINALLILVFAGLAWRYARRRQIDLHRRWALRTFMVVSGVWFIRIGLMGWIIINQGPVGMNRTLSGPADIAIVFGSYLIPLAVLEVYLRAKRSTRALQKALAVGVVGLSTAFTAVGVFGAIVLLWLPDLK